MTRPRNPRREELPICQNLLVEARKSGNARSLLSGQSIVEPLSTVYGVLPLDQEHLSAMLRVSQGLCLTNWKIADVKSLRNSASIKPPLPMVA
jgi:hypothetical protein